ncbi:MAG: TonB-dependent receptor [Hydrococcus sp. Prado102]|jgi:iron complex outermembrane receptor protein|nr:TonB-dependent receptor [Hydrococcus sp. Prado102]
MKLDKLFQSLLLASAIVLSLGIPAKSEKARKDIPQLNEIKVRASKEQILGRIPTSDISPFQKEKQENIVPITGVEVNSTDSGVEVVLQTPLGEQLQISDRAEKNNFIAEIPNAQLKKPFRVQNPVTGIREITIINLDEKTVQVTVVGETAPLQVELFDSDEGLILSLTPANSSTQTPPTPQPEASQIIAVTGVQLNPTETGIELLLQTPPQSAEQLQPNNISSGNNFIADIPNAQLQLPDNQPFRVEKPIEGISEVTVNNVDASTIRVTAVGETVLPQVELFDSDSGLIFGFTPSFTRGESEGGQEAQTPTPPQPQEGQIVTIESVKLNPTETGFEILLLTPTGTAQQLRVVNISEGNNFIAEIPNAQIQPFRAENPIEGVSEVTVTNRDENTVLVTVIGEDKQPIIELFDSEEGLIFSATSETQTAQEEDIELVVTGEQDGYRVPNTSIGTRTDTPLRDIPQSIQIIPQQVLEEQQANTLNEALRNAPGVIQTAPNYLPAFNGFTIRGFETFSIRNGLSYSFAGGTTAILSNIERIEVLRGPASVLFGSGPPGGTINIVTKQPLREPFYELEATAGSYNFYQGAVDLAGPLNDSRTILYRLNASYESGGNFVDFQQREVPAVAGALRFEIGDSTDLTFNVEYSDINQGWNPGLPAVGTVLPNPNGEIPRNRNIADEDSEYDPEVLLVGYDLEHRFSENWSLRNSFYFADLQYRNINLYAFNGFDPDLRTIQRGVDSGIFDTQTFDSIANVVGRFSTGSIQHQILLGADLRRRDDRSSFLGVFNAAPLDLFDPVYSSERFEQTELPFVTTGLTDSLGIYVQDRVTLTDNLKLLLGGRFDAFEQTDRNLTEDTETFQSGNAFSPRLGIVYQPIEPISLYASYSRSFTPTIGRSRDDELFEPGRGTQYEIGIKADINDRLSATLALYDLTRTNVTTADPDDPNFQIQTGEQNSRGVELNVAGEILPGWNIIAGYAYTDARITEDNTFEVGNRLNNVPEHSVNLWTSYEIQEGDLQGLGFGVGLFYVGDRQGDLDNSFALPSYLRTDAAIFYTRGQFRASLNFNNLFDVDYFESANSDSSVYPGEPFTVRGTLSWRF